MMIEHIFLKILLFITTMLLTAHVIQVLTCDRIVDYWNDKILKFRMSHESHGRAGFWLCRSYSSPNAKITWQ